MKYGLEYVGRHRRGMNEAEGPVNDAYRFPLEAGLILVFLPNTIVTEMVCSSE